VVHRLTELVEFHVLAPAPSLDSDVVDARTEDQPDRSETGLSYKQELVYRQIGREKPFATIGKPGASIGWKRDVGEGVSHGVVLSRVTSCGSGAEAWFAD
jgi:hypothetical protein